MNNLITYDIATKIWGCEPDLGDDSTRRAFFAVWAFAILEMEEMIRRERSIRRNIVIRKLRDLFRRITSL